MAKITGSLVYKHGYNSSRPYRERTSKMHSFIFIHVWHRSNKKIKECFQLVNFISAICQPQHIAHLICPSWNARYELIWVFISFAKSSLALPLNKWISFVDFLLLIYGITYTVHCVRILYVPEKKLGLKSSLMYLMNTAKKKYIKT